MDDNLKLAPGATDCHTHLFGPEANFPYAVGRAYTPMDALEADLDRVMAQLGVSRVVLIHASVHSDNGRILRGLERLGSRARAVIQLEGIETPDQLGRMSAAGVAGVRVNNVSTSRLRPHEVAARVITVGRQVADLGWHVEVLVSGDDLKAVLATLDECLVPVVVDHFGLVGVGPQDEVVRESLVRRLAEGRCWVKLSGAYRLPGDSNQTARKLTRLFVNANDERLVWGSDWPHPPANRTAENATTPQPFRNVDTLAMLNGFVAAVPDGGQRRKILVDNPAALYGF